MVNWSIVKPVKIFGLNAGTLTVGALTDVAAFDITQTRTIDKEDFLLEEENTPFIGRKVKGEAQMTFVNEKFVWQKGE